jgi:hypothetical protein
MFEALIEYMAKKFIDLGFKKRSEQKKVDAKKDQLVGNECRSIEGIWICQYRYPRMDDKAGTKIQTTETQLVRFVQTSNRVNGETLFAAARPEDFEGVVTKDRYFTGMYFNQKNHHSYHGAFQFIISHSANRMNGKWIGFNREGDAVDSNDWRWEQIDDNPNISKEKEHEYMSKAQSADLFSIEVFI